MVVGERRWSAERRAGAGNLARARLKVVNQSSPVADELIGDLGEQHSLCCYSLELGWTPTVRIMAAGCRMSAAPLAWEKHGTHSGRRGQQQVDLGRMMGPYIFQPFQQWRDHSHPLFSISGHQSASRDPG